MTIIFWLPMFVWGYYFLVYRFYQFIILQHTLVALTLMIAESRPEEKDIMVRVVVNLVNLNNQ